MFFALTSQTQKDEEVTEVLFAKCDEYYANVVVFFRVLLWEGHIPLQI